MTTMTETKNCMDCGAPTQHEIPEDVGRFAAFLRGVQIRCDDCQGRVDEAEAKAEAVAAQEENARLMLGRITRSGVPASLRGKTLEGLDRDLTNGEAIDAAAEWVRGEYWGLVLAGPVGVGKAQPLDALILTPTGWREMGEIQAGDEVIGGDGRPTRVTAIHPQGTRPLYRVSFSDGSTTRCDPDHLWTVAGSDAARRPSPRSDRPGLKRGSPWRTVTTREILAAGVRRRAGHPKWQTPVAPAVEFAEGEELELAPYLVGALLGDGCMTRQVSFSTADAEILEMVEAGLPGGVTAKPQGRTGYDYGLTGPQGRGANALLDGLRTLGLIGHDAGSKFIPQTYLLAAREDREDLLRGLLDTDGYVGAGRSNIEYVTVSRQLADDMNFLVRSLGGLCRVAEKPTTHRLAYRLTITPPVGLKPFALGRKAAAHRERQRGNPTRYITDIESIDPAEAQCISVEAADGLYITDDFIVTHNTWISAAAANEMLRQREVRWFAAPRFMTQARAGFKHAARDQITDVLTRPDIALVLDDLDKVNPTDFTKEVLFTAIDERLTAGTPLVVTTNQGYEEIEEIFGEPIASRLSTCRGIRLDGDDRRRKAA